MPHFVKIYLLPGLVFQGIIIGGGYATGRELVEFFMPAGPVGGLLGMGVAALVWGLVMAASFELCRLSGSFDYRHFFSLLLGRWWFLYEVLFLLTLTVSLAVIGAAAGSIVSSALGAPPVAGTALLLLCVAVLAFLGSGYIERFMGLWSLLLYATYCLLVAWCVSSFGGELRQTFAAATVTDTWLYDGIRYAGYNVAAVPAVFFCLRHIERRHQAITAGLVGGFVAIVPAMLLFVALLTAYPSIMAAEVPTAALLQRLNAPWFNAVFQLVLIGTFVQTGVGLVHAVNERVAATLATSGRDLSGRGRLALALALLLVAFVLAERVGIVALIASGFGLLTWGFILVFVVPVLTIGLWLIARPAALSRASGAGAAMAPPNVPVAVPRNEAVEASPGGPGSQDEASTGATR